jgi:hypothetical protein
MHNQQVQNRETDENTNSPRDASSMNCFAADHNATIRAGLFLKEVLSMIFLSFLIELRTA